MKPARIPADLVAYICDQFAFTGDEAELVRGASLADLYSAHTSDDMITVLPPKGQDQ